MDDHALGLVSVIALSTVALVVLAGAAAGVLYAMDYGLEATVVDKDCPRLGAGSVTVETKTLGIQHTLDVPQQQCMVLLPGNFAVYHINSGRTILYQEEGGRCIYDSSRGVGC